jgi:quercetin dioxygenase-like cupin family protein
MGRKTREKSVGKKIARLRRGKNLSVQDVAHETGFTTEFIEQVEAGEALPPVAFLIRISKALSVDAGSLLSEEAERAASEKRRRSFVKRTQEYSYQVLTPGAETKHLKAFVVTIDPMKEHKMVEYSHEGEEFIYVLKGRIEVLVGENSTILKREQTIHFNSAIVHRLRNLGKEPAKLIVVIYTP